MNGPVQPDYVTFDNKQREAFLSQLGSFSPTERELFHKIVKTWAAEIGYGTILRIASAESVTAKNDLDSLMTKLKASRVGLVTSGIQDGARVPNAIVLCNQDDPWFFYKLVEEELMELVGNLPAPLPSLQSLAKKNIVVPKSAIANLDFEQLAQLNAQKEVRDLQIFSVESLGASFLLTTANARRFMTVALAKMQAFLLNANLLAFLAQLRKTGLTELKKNIEAREPAFWIGLSKELLDKQELFKQNRKLTLDENFFRIAYFLYSFMTKQLEEMKKRKQAEEERLLDMKTLLEQVKAAPTWVVTEERFAEMLMEFKKKHESDFASFKSDFEERYLTAAERKSLPPLVHIARSYIHCDNVHVLFAFLVEKQGKDLFTFYARQIELYLKHPKSGEAGAFYSQNNFEANIEEQVKNGEPLLFELLQRPQMIAEALIAHLRRQKENRSQEDIRQSLSPFFYTDRIRFREASVLFGLNTRDLFRIAFMKLSIFKQFFMKVSGKYDSYRKKFETLGADAYAEKENASPDAENQAPEKPRDPRAEAQERARERARAAAVKAKEAERETAKSTRKTGGAPQKPTAQKPAADASKYSQRDKESAWDNFSKTIKKPE